MKKARFSITYCGTVDMQGDKEAEGGAEPDLTNTDQVQELIEDSFAPDLMAGVEIDRKEISVHIYDEPETVKE